MYRDTLSKAFFEGFEMGRAHARKVYGEKKGSPIHVEYIPSTEILEIVELDCGGLLNLGGRSLPF